MKKIQKILIILLINSQFNNKEKTQAIQIQEEVQCKILGIIKICK